MNEKEARIQKWLEKFKAFLNDYSQKCEPFITKKYPKTRRVRWPRFSTQQIRKYVVRTLTDLYDLALEYARDETIELEERMKWSRVAAFIAQTINAVLKTHDIFEIEKAIKELEKYVKSHVGGN